VAGNVPQILKALGEMNQNINFNINQVNQNISKEDHYQEFVTEMKKQKDEMKTIIKSIDETKVLIEQEENLKSLTMNTMGTSLMQKLEEQNVTLIGIQEEVNNMEKKITENIFEERLKIEHDIGVMILNGVAELGNGIQISENRN
jgi:hypothetical protein